MAEIGKLAWALNYLHKVLHPSLSFSSLSTMWKSIRKHFERKEMTRPEEIAQEHNQPPDQDTTRPEEIAQEQNQPTNEDRIAPRGANSRFRVLILGPANAGKTTLLERLTDSPAGAAIMTRNGQRVIVHFPLYRYSGLIYSFISQIEEVPRGDDQVGAIIASVRCACLTFLSYLAGYTQC